MKIQIFLNTDGYLGAWGASTIARKGALVFEIPNQDIPLFHKAIDGRNGVEVLLDKKKKHDVEFGNLRLKFHQLQNEKLVKQTKKAHKHNKKKSHLEEAIF
jgi:hypothetical protein